MTQWRATAALGRAVLVAASGLALAVLFGDPVLIVLTAPFGILGALGLLHRPVREPEARSVLAHPVLHEGQGTTSRLVLREVDDVEHVTRVTSRAPYLALRPPHGTVGSLLDADARVADTFISPRRWGRRLLGEEKVALTTRWAGYRWGPVILNGDLIEVLPATAPFDSHAELPQPVGLVGAHRSRRVGDGTEFSGIRPFHAGDRLRRVNWRVSLRSDELHVVDTRAEEDSAVLVVVDALADYGTSGGVDGAPSSLDVSVRAAAALAEHHSRTGDRVGLRVVGASGQVVGFGAGARHLRVILGQLARIRPGTPHDLSAEPLQFRVTAGTVVMVLSPMLSEVMTSSAAALMRRGIPVMVIDTLPEAASPAAREGVPSQVADLAWRMRRVERDLLLDRLAGTGCPVVTVARPRHPRRGAAPPRPPLPAAPGGAPMTIARMSLGEWVLRLLIAVTPALAALCTIGAGEGPPVWFVALLLLLGIGFAVFPESAVGVVVIVLVLAWWGLGLRDGLDPWALPAAALLLTGHVSALLVSYGPGELELDPRVVRLWVGRGLLVFLASPVFYAVGVWLRDAPEPPGMWVTGLTAAFAATMVVSFLMSRTRGT